MESLTAGIGAESKFLWGQELSQPDAASFICSCNKTVPSVGATSLYPVAARLGLFGGGTETRFTHVMVLVVSSLWMALIYMKFGSVISAGVIPLYFVLVTAYVLFFGL
ncbi:hypothetical protein VNO80_21508 [Phaseolus coccineus]|uniref:Uncharacterized protein n=1 Tax=Phaseolus coccineus TaxID=3886 RepID=A0AAN9QTE4_PHACN